MAGSEGGKRRGRTLETLYRASIDGKEPMNSGGTQARPLRLKTTDRLIQRKTLVICTTRPTAALVVRPWCIPFFSIVLLVLNRVESPSLDHVVPIWEWMRSIRTDEESVAGFYLPEYFCGPNLVFAMNLNSKSDRRVLCVLQVVLRSSVGASGLLTFVRFKKLQIRNVGNLEQAVSTTNSQMSYKFRKWLRKTFREELNSWKDIIIIRILVCTAKRLNRVKNARYLNVEEKQEKNSRVVSYPCYTTRRILKLCLAKWL